MAKHSSYTAAFKLKIVETEQRKSEIKSARREHLVSEKLVRDWRKKKADLNVLLKGPDRSRLEYIIRITIYSAVQDTLWWDLYSCNYIARYRTRCGGTYIPVII